MISDLEKVKNLKYKCFFLCLITIVIKRVTFVSLNLVKKFSGLNIFSRPLNGPPKSLSALKLGENGREIGQLV